METVAYLDLYDQWPLFEEQHRLHQRLAGLQREHAWYEYVINELGDLAEAPVVKVIEL